MKEHCEREISILKSLVGFLAVLAGMALLNFFPDRVGYYLSAMDPRSFTPVLAAVLWVYIPWLNLWWGLRAVLQLVHLITKRWTSATRIADLLLSGLGLYVLGKILMGGPLFVSPWASFVAKLLLGLAIVILVVGTGRRHEGAWLANERELRPGPVGD